MGRAGRARRHPLGATTVIELHDQGDLGGGVGLRPRHQGHHHRSASRPRATDIDSYGLLGGYAQSDEPKSSVLPTSSSASTGLEGEASTVASGIRRSATLRGLAKADRKNADKCADYLLKNKQYLHYNEYLAAGLPIATGVIEGACRHLVKDRMDITGARWGLEGAEAVLRLRSLRSSGDFDEYWAFHERQEFIRNHRSRYADDKVPPLEKPQEHGHLRVIK